MDNSLYSNLIKVATLDFLSVEARPERLMLKGAKQNGRILFLKDPARGLSQRRPTRPCITFQSPEVFLRDIGWTRFCGLTASHVVQIQVVTMAAYSVIPKNIYICVFASPRLFWTRCKWWLKRWVNGACRRDLRRNSAELWKHLRTAGAVYEEVSRLISVKGGCGLESW